MSPEIKQETLTLTPQDVSTVANRLATDTLAYYSQNDEFLVEQSEDGQVRTVTIKRDMGHERDSRHFVVAQTMTFNGDTLTSVHSEWGGNWYNYSQEENSIYFGTDYTGNGNAQWHMVRGVVSKDEQSLEEVTRVQVNTDLQARYVATQLDGTNGFSLDQVLLHQYLPLSEEDVKKFLPNGRFITLEDVMASVVDPYRSNNRYYNERVPELCNIEGFPKFDYWHTGPHSTTFVSTLDHNTDKVHGFAHPYEDSPDDWLVFVRFSRGEEAIGRALRVSIDRDSVGVIDVEGVPTITCNVAVDGENFNLTLPEGRVKWVEASEESKGKAIRTHKHDETSPEMHLIPITADELRESIKDGYYYTDMLDGAIESFYNKYYSGTEVVNQ